MKLIVEEVIAYVKTLRATASEGGGEWSWIGKNQRAGYLESIYGSDHSRLSEFLLNPLDTEAAYGLITPVNANPLNSKFLNEFEKDLGTYKDLFGTHSLEELKHKYLLQHPFQNHTEQFYCYPDSPRHAYSAKRISIFTEVSGVGLEIGGGYGGLITYLNKFGHLGKLINCDLFETLLIAYVFLRFNGIDVNLCLTSDDFYRAFDSSVKVLLITPEVLEELSEIENLQFVFNSRSLSEMSRDQSLAYLNQINHRLQPKVIFLENAEWLEYPESARHIEVTQDEFATALSNYDLIQNSKSIFMGGAGRYSERIYLLR